MEGDYLKIKIAVIAVLLFTIISSACMGTLSSFTTGFENNAADISPDIERIQSMYYEDPGSGNKKIEPDLKRLPDNLIMGMLYVTQDLNINNSYSFVAFTKQIYQLNDISLTIGSPNDERDYYLIYFRNRIKINFYDGTRIWLDGFYYIKPGQDLFDDSLYTTIGKNRTLNNNPYLFVCPNPKSACQELGIPIKK